MSTLRAVPLRPHPLPPPPPVADSPCDGVDGDGPGLVQVLRDEHLAGRPVEASPPTPTPYHPHPLWPTHPAMGSMVMARGSSRSSEMSTLRAVPLRPHPLPPPPPVADSPCDGVDGDGPGLVQVLRDEHLAGRPVQPGHLYPVRAGVRPVEVAGDDVDGDPVRMVHFL